MHNCFTMIQLLNTTPIKVDDVADVTRNLKLAFTSGATKSYEWRIYQLKRLKDLFLENKEKLIQAVQKDLGKSLPFEVTLSEYNLPLEGIFFSYSCLDIRELEETISNLKAWMEPEQVNTNMAGMNSPL